MRSATKYRLQLSRVLCTAGLAAIVTAAVSVTNSGASSSGSRHTVKYIVANPRISLSGPLKSSTVEGSTYDNYQNGRRVGLDYVGCTFVDTHNDNECTVTVSLPGGTMELVYQGNVNDAHLTCPIVGGTGRYLGARGYTTLSPTHGGELAVAHLL